MCYKYTSLENHFYIDYFTDPDIFVPEEHRKDIKPLTKISATEFWEKYISSRNRHPMLLDEKDWFSTIKLQELAHCQNDWSKNNYKRITDILKSKVPWPENTVVYFCQDKSNITETTWNTFTTYWINFLFNNDEGPILITKENNEIFTFSPYGLIYFGLKDS